MPDGNHILKKLLPTLCGLLSGGALFAIMGLTFFDVLGRKLLDNSIPGSLEVTELPTLHCITKGANKNRLSWIKRKAAKFLVFR